MALTNVTPVTVSTSYSGPVLSGANRQTIVFQNRSSSTEIFLGGSGVTAASGIGLAPGATWILSASDAEQIVDEAWYAITASGTAELRILTA